jgi:hypothetical protein
MRIIPIKIIKTNYKTKMNKIIKKGIICNFFHHLFLIKTDFKIIFKEEELKECCQLKNLIYIKHCSNLKNINTK